jgi:hypothetical protein
MALRVAVQLLSSDKATGKPNIKLNMINFFSG